ncbi:hypothetical protein FOZ60_010507 [Perkinsus olseni]|uniref:Amino acid transporter transmembrane domain-containing protein n=1 Tax=Perkinsus olseni TaxID=32597 RepID=A0A7J6PC81_PEROL|nr:hypothetical protein FOZ60_010507 [Perkinsus olseni]
MGVEQSPFLSPQELPSYESAAMKNLTTLEGHGYSTPLSTVFNIVNTMVGLGMFALPYVFGAVGYLTGSIIFIGAVLASYLSAYVLTMVLSGYLEEYSYYALAIRLFKGHAMSVAIDAVLAVVLFGVISMTFVVSFDSVHSYFPGVPRWMLGGMAALAGWAASLPKSLHGVRFASYTGVGLMLLIWVSVVFTAIIAPHRLELMDEELVPPPPDTARRPPRESSLSSCTSTSPAFTVSSSPSTRPKMPLLLAIALSWAFAMYIIFAVCASSSPLFLYGRAPDLLMTLPRTLLFDTCRVLMALVNITKTPLLLHPLRQVIDTRLNVPEQLNWLATSAIILISYCLFPVVQFSRRGCVGHLRYLFDTHRPVVSSRLSVGISQAGRHSKRGCPAPTQIRLPYLPMVSYNSPRGGGHAGPPRHLGSGFDRPFYCTPCNETVVGYLETPGDVPPRVIDVAHFEFPDEKRDYFKFAFVADEDALKRFNNPLIEMLNASEATPRSPPSLKEHLMHNLGSEILEGYEEKFNHNKELYCMLQSTPSRGPECPYLVFFGEWNMQATQLFFG